MACITSLAKHDLILALYMFNGIDNKTHLKYLLKTNRSISCRIVLNFVLYELQGLKVESIKFYIRWTLTAVDKQQ